MPGRSFNSSFFVIRLRWISKLPTGFDAAQPAYQSVAHIILGQDVAGDGLFVELTGIEILHRASASLGCSQGSFLDPLGDLLHMVAKVFEEDLVRPETAHHPLRIADGAKVSRNTKRSNPESVPAILSWCLAINSCMGVLLRIVVGLGTTCNDTQTGNARNASVSPHPRLVSTI